MNPGEASTTAMINALFRAIESHRRPSGRRLFTDPFAMTFLGMRDKALVYLSRIPLLGRGVTLYIDRNWPGVRPSLLSRTRWIDDQLHAVLRDGIGQIVILGAGYDTRAYRVVGAENTRVFEVDHPNTIGIKMKGISTGLGRIPSNVVYVPVDFERQDFMSELLNRDFNKNEPTFFLMEGVMHYLEADTVDSVFRSIRALSAPRSKFVFSYIHRGLMDGSVDFGEMGRVAQTLEDAGELWKFDIDPEELRDFLDMRGFRLLLDAGSKEYRAQYMGPKGRHLKGFGFYRIAAAEVGSD